LSVSLASQIGMNVEANVYKVYLVKF